jgi:glutamate 5-kinase
LSSYGHKDAMAIRGHKSNEIESVLGYRERDEMIHADNLVMSDG